MTSPIRDQLRTLFDARIAAIEAAIETIPDARLFIPVAPQTNSAGNLALHIAGNLRTLVGRVAGDVPYERDRDREFQATGPSKRDVLDELRVAADVTREVLDRLDEEWESAPAAPLFEGDSRGDHLLRALEHTGYHTGQIVLIARVHTLIADPPDAG